MMQPTEKISVCAVMSDVDVSSGDPNHKFGTRLKSRTLDIKSTCTDIGSAVVNGYMKFRPPTLSLPSAVT